MDPRDWGVEATISFVLDHSPHLSKYTKLLRSEEIDGEVFINCMGEPQTLEVLGIPESDWDAFCFLRTRLAAYDKLDK